MTAVDVNYQAERSITHILWSTSNTAFTVYVLAKSTGADHDYIMEFFYKQSKIDWRCDKTYSSLQQSEAIVLVFVLLLR